MYGATGTQEMLRAATSLRASKAMVIWCYLYESGHEVKMRLSYTIESLNLVGEKLFHAGVQMSFY